jgi:DNA-binding FadR family transcriptional regulator
MGSARSGEIGTQFHAALIDAAHNRAFSAQFKAWRVVLEPIYAQRTTDVIIKRIIATNRRILDAERACSLVRRRLEIVRARPLLKAQKRSPG